MVNFPLAPKEHDKTSVPIGLHETEDWDKTKAVRLVKRAAMHYYKRIGDSNKSGGFELGSNVPTIIMATEAMTPNMMVALGGGATLVASFGVEAVINARRCARLLKVIDEFETNKKDPDKKHEAAEILERRTHGLGLLLENIPEYDLRYYPEKLFNGLNLAKKSLTDKNEFSERVLDVSLNLRFNPLDSAKKVLGVTTATTKQTAKLVALPITLPLTMVKDSVENFVDFDKLRNIFHGLISIPQIPGHNKFWSLNPRHKVKQRPFYSQLQNGTLPEGHVGHKIITEEDIEELQQTNKALRWNNLAEKGEAIRFTGESAFMTAHVNAGIENFDGESLQQGFQNLANGDLTFSGQDWRCMGSIGSLIMAWEPFAHIGKNLKTLRELGETHRSEDIQHYKKALDQIDNATKELEEAKEKEGPAPE